MVCISNICVTNFQYFNNTITLLLHSGGDGNVPIAEKHFDAKQETFEDDQGPPIENEPIVNEEWLAFIHMSMQEVLNGETDSLKHQNLVRYSFDNLSI